jgi:hypothetical protein
VKFRRRSGPETLLSVTGLFTPTSHFRRDDEGRNHRPEVACQVVDLNFVVPEDHLVPTVVGASTEEVRDPSLVACLAAGSCRGDVDNVTLMDCEVGGAHGDRSRVAWAFAAVSPAQGCTRRSPRRPRLQRFPARLVPSTFAHRHRFQSRPRHPTQALVLPSRCSSPVRRSLVLATDVLISRCGTAQTTAFCPNDPRYLRPGDAITVDARGAQAPSVPADG